MEMGKPVVARSDEHENTLRQRPAVRPRRQGQSTAGARPPQFAFPSAVKVSNGQRKENRFFSSKISLVWITESPFGCRRQFSPAWESWCPTSPFLDHESKISDQFLDAYDAGIGGGLFGNGSAGANCMAGASSTPTDWEGYQTVHRIESRRAGWAGKSPLEILLRADQAGLQGMARGNQVPERLRTAGGRYLLAPSVEDVERWLEGPEECSPITGDNMPKHDHHKAAAHHDEAAKSHRKAAEAHEKGDHADASQHSQIANDHSAKAYEASQSAHAKTKGPKKL